MARGDIQIRRAVAGHPEVVTCKVALGTAASIKAGEIVLESSGGYVIACAAGASVTTSNNIVGIAVEDSTETTTVAGEVKVALADPSITWFLRAGTTYAITQLNTNVTIARSAGGDFTLANATTTNGVARLVAYDSGANSFEFTIKGTEVGGA